MIFERIGRIFAPSNLVEKEEASANSYGKTIEICKGRSMVGYSRRGFLGMLGAVAVGGMMPKPHPLSLGIIDVTSLHVGETLIPRDYYSIIWPILRHGPAGSFEYFPELIQHYIPFASPMAGSVPLSASGFAPRVSK